MAATREQIIKSLIEAPIRPFVSPSTVVLVNGVTAADLITFSSSGKCRSTLHFEAASERGFCVLL